MENEIKSFAVASITSHITYELKYEDYIFSLLETADEVNYFRQKMAF